MYALERERLFAGAKCVNSTKFLGCTVTGRKCEACGKVFLFLNLFSLKKCLCIALN